MAKERSLVRASDIGRWAYCNRAWWLAVVGKAPHQQPERLQAGTAAHEQHGQRVDTAARMARRARIGLLIGFAIVLIGLVLRLMGGWGF